MTIIVTSTENDTIIVPGWLLKALNLHDGDKVKAIVDGQSIHLSPLDKFLALRGKLKDDNAFEQAVQELEQAWSAWPTNQSV